MRRYIRGINVDGVISFLETPNLICEISGFPTRKWKLIVGERSTDPRIYNSFKRLFFRWMHIFSDKIIANSSANIKMVNKIVPCLLKNKTHVIYNLLDSNYWSVSKNYSPLKNKKIELVVAATHLYYKNSIGLIKAVNCLTKQEQQTLRVSWYGKVGNDNSFIEAKQLISKYNLGHVIKFYKESNNINSIYANCDAVGLFSFIEGLPNTVCEGMMMQKPVISSNVSDIPELISNNKAIFNPNNITEIKDSLSWLISLDKEQLLKTGKENREKALKLFDKENVIESYLNYFKKN